MNRDEWEFEYGADELAKAAAEKIEFHQGRVAWWEGKKEEVMKEVRATGIDITESVAASYSNTTQHYGPQITIDGTLQRKLGECHSKVMEHDGKRRDYDGWRQLLEANSKARLKLNQDDWLFFFGR